MLKDDQKLFDGFKRYSKKGFYGPLEVVRDPKEGFIVKALKKIPKKTIIAEYAGQVCRWFLHQEDNASDSLMTLIDSKYKGDLIICPEDKANLAKFISGINNSDLSAKKKKQNVTTFFYYFLHSLSKRYKAEDLLRIEKL